MDLKELGLIDKADSEFSSGYLYDLTSTELRKGELFSYTSEGKKCLWKNF